MKIELTIPTKEIADELERIIHDSPLFLLQTGPDSYVINWLPGWCSQQAAQARCDAVTTRSAMRFTGEL